MAAIVLPQNSIPEELTLLDDYVSIYRKYPRYKRITSIARLAARGLPVLKGFATRAISEEILLYLECWMRERSIERLTLLFDSTHTGDLTGLTAFTLTLAELQAIGCLLQGPIVAIIMEENDQLQQSHSLSASFSEDHVLCELVGPGFEINDLTQGHISPHERFLFRRKDRNDDNFRDLGPADLIEHFFIAQEDYRRSVEIRYSKIHDMMLKGPGHAVRTSSLDQMQRQAIETLLKQRNSTLLYHRNQYTTIDFERLREFYGFISELDVFYSDFVRGTVLEASFVKKHGLVFWGISGGNPYNNPCQAWPYVV